MGDMRVDQVEWVDVDRDGSTVRLSMLLTATSGPVRDGVTPDQVPADMVRVLQRWLGRTGRP